MRIERCCTMDFFFGWMPFTPRLSVGDENRDGSERLSQRRDERKGLNPDKGMENRVCQIDCREKNTHSEVSCIERGSERSRENQKERLQYLAAGTATPQKAGYGTITDRMAG